jgi:phenylpyruvate tautomerase PptA (4-oxalocrotonate tautomerase family)
MTSVTAASTPLTYTAVCQRAGPWWEITVPELDETTQAPRLRDVPATVADLVAHTTGADPQSIRVEMEAQVAAGPGVSASGWLRAAVTAAILAVIIRRVTRVRHPGGQSREK